MNPGIETFELKKMQNKHQNFTHQFSKRLSYRLKNPKQGSSTLERYNATTQNMQWLIQQSLHKGERLRALGSKWSFNKIGFTKDRIVDTKSLRIKFGLRPAHLNTSTNIEAGNLFLLQCGNTIIDINAHLEGRGRQLKKCLLASGASNGQTIAGAISTNTHGSAFNFGAVHDAVRGIHLVTGPDSHVFVQKESAPVVNQQFANLLGLSDTSFISDDDVFNSVLVSFGSMGIIHGVLLETAPIFHLEKYRTRLPLSNQLFQAMDTLNFSNLNLPQPINPSASELYHWALVVNPYEVDNGGKGIYMTTIYKVPYQSNQAKTTLSDRGFTYGDDTLGIIKGLIDKLRPFSQAAIKPLVNTIIRNEYKDSEVFPWLGTMGETFSYTSLRGKAASMAFAVDIQHASACLQLILHLIKNEKPFPGVLGIRFIKGTEATLGFTHFPKSCVIELDGVDSKLSQDFYALLWKRLNQQQIPFSLHWGKINHYLNEDTLSAMYGSAKIDEWKKVRNWLLDSEQLKAVFTNAFMERLGLDKMAVGVDEEKDVDVGELVV